MFGLKDGGRRGKHGTDRRPDSAFRSCHVPVPPCRRAGRAQLRSALQRPCRAPAGQAACRLGPGRSGRGRDRDARRRNRIRHGGGGRSLAGQSSRAVGRRAVRAGGAFGQGLGPGRRCAGRRCLAVRGPVEHGVRAGAGQRRASHDRQRRGRPAAAHQYSQGERAGACARFRQAGGMGGRFARDGAGLFGGLLLYGAQPAPDAESAHRRDQCQLGRHPDPRLARSRRIARHLWRGGSPPC